MKDVRDILSVIEDVAKRRQLLFRVHRRSRSLKAESAENGNARNIITGTNAMDILFSHMNRLRFPIAGIPLQKRNKNG
jgi:hypothetical protein